MQDRGIECNYEPCSCRVIGSAATGEAYCSDYCQQAFESSVESEACSCGHPQCDT